MSKFGLVIVLILTAGRNYAQEYFVLIQADSSQSFYVRMGGQLYSSSGGGHLILPQLKDSTYTVTVGLPGQSFSEQCYSFDVHQKDQVFRLKSVNGVRWGLYDRQGQELKIIDAGESASRRPRIAGIKKDDAFSRLMADVVRDTAVMYNTYAMPQMLNDSVAKLIPGVGGGADSAMVLRVWPSSLAAGHDTAVAISRDTAVATGAAPIDSPARAVVPGPVIGNTAAAMTTAPIYRPVSKDSAVSGVSPYKPSVVVKVSERKSSRSLRLVYADAGTNSKPDTIVIIIPVDTGRVIPFVNSDCHSYATDYDVDKLRVKMLESVKDDDRIQEARKFFKTKCFSTHQIKALSEVFMTDAAKFKFLETAYPFVSDDRFRELVGLLADPVYSGRFRAMTERP